jgi:glutathione-specific gamma-glutamylcyclotransferase
MPDRDPPEKPQAALPPPEGQQYAITRENLADGSLLARIRAEAPEALRFQTEEELDRDVARTLADLPADTDLWLFGYGSLIWNPVIDYAERRVATIHGYHRSYCLWLHLGRGSPERPGLMLALDHGGSCSGVAFRIPRAQAMGEMRLVWRREMAGRAYKARWVTAQTPDGPARALTFVVDRHYPRYAGKLPDAEIAARIATAAGSLGTCTAYLSDTIGALNALGLRDRMLDRIARQVAALAPRDAEAPIAPPRIL